MQHAKVGLRRVRIARLAYRTGRRHVRERGVRLRSCTSCGSYPLRKSSMHFGGTWQAALSWHGVPARSRFNDTRRACANKLWSMSVEIWGAAGPNPLEQLRQQFHRKYLSTAEASKIQMQSTVQDAIVGEPLHGKHAIFDMCFVCANASSA